MKKVILSALGDGFLQNVALQVASAFVVSAFVFNWTVMCCLLVFILLAIGISAICWVLVMRMQKNKLIAFFAFDMLWFAFWCMVGLALRITFPLHIFPVRETNAGDGLLVVIGWICFISISAILRICIFLVRFLKKS